MPPLQALVALHGLWALALLPFVIWGMRKWSPSWLRFVGHALSAVGLLAVVVLVGRELLTWYPSVTLQHPRYITQRVLYTLATSTDLPAVQVFVAGIALWITAWRRKRV
jgi:hypothetical protein